MLKKHKNQTNTAKTQKYLIDLWIIPFFPPPRHFHVFTMTAFRGCQNTSHTLTKSLMKDTWGSLHAFVTGWNPLPQKAVQAKSRNVIQKLD